MPRPRDIRLDRYIIKPIAKISSLRSLCTWSATSEFYLSAHLRNEYNPQVGYHATSSQGSSQTRNEVLHDRVLYKSSEAIICGRQLSKVNCLHEQLELPRQVAQSPGDLNN